MTWKANNACLYRQFIKVTTQTNTAAAIMDPYSAEGELINIHNHFHQGQYQEVIDFDTSSFSAENAVPARVLVLRARIALGQAQEVLADVKGESEPDFEVIGAFAEYTLGKTEAALKTVEKLASSAADNVTVQVVGGIVLQAADKSEDALALLSQHQGSCKFENCSNMMHCWETLTQRNSGSRCLDCSDPPATKPNRSGCKGSCCR